MLLGDRVRKRPRFPGSVTRGALSAHVREGHTFTWVLRAKDSFLPSHEPHHKGDPVGTHQRSKTFFARGLGGQGLKGPFPSRPLGTLLEVHREAPCPSWPRAAGQEELHGGVLRTGFTSWGMAVCRLSAEGKSLFLRIFTFFTNIFPGFTSPQVQRKP